MESGQIGEEQSPSDPKLASLRKERRNLYDDYEDGIDDEPVIRIPVVFHVLYSNDDENLSEKQLQSQIDVLNKDFRANNEEINDGDVNSIWTSRVGDTKIEFYRYAIERVSIEGKSSSFCSTESNIKKSSNGGSDSWDPYTYLNFWVCDLSADGLLGMMLFFFPFLFFFVFSFFLVLLRSFALVIQTRLVSSGGINLLFVINILAHCFYFCFC